MQDFNIRTAARYFAGVLGQNGGNVLQSIGTYNGWTPGLTVVCLSWTRRLTWTNDFTRNRRQEHVTRAAALVRTTLTSMYHAPRWFNCKIEALRCFTAYTNS